MRRVQAIAVLAWTAAALLPAVGAATPQTLPDPAAIAAAAPAPLYRDPVYDGAADPVVVWNAPKRVWSMFYTQRRARLNLPGVEWGHGTEVGVAESRDEGMTWVYQGRLKLEHPNPEGSFWAPDCIRDDAGRYHLFVTFVPGAAATHRDFSGERHIVHYSSDDLSTWKFEQRVPVSSDYCIDPTLCRRPDGQWWMWFKDERHESETRVVGSRDLHSWHAVAAPGVSRLYGEGPKVFRYRGHYWMIKDPNCGLDVYRSENLEDWTYQGKILDKPGWRNDDASVGKHCDVVVCGDRAYIFYLVEPGMRDVPPRAGIQPLVGRRSAIQAAELEVKDGPLTCDRNRLFRIRLTPPDRGQTARVKGDSPIFVGTKIATAPYRAIPATGFWGAAGTPPQGFDPAFAQGLYGWTGSKSGTAAAFQFQVHPSGKYLVAIGYFDPNTPPGKRLQEVLIDGRKVDQLDTAGQRPFVRLYEAADRNGDGFLQVSCSHVTDEGGATGLMNIVWLFAAEDRDKVDAEKLARGECTVTPLCRFDSAAAERGWRGHVDFPPLPEARLRRMLPLRPAALGIEPARPQPVDPLNLEIQGELRDRIRTVLDRWGFAGRDQKRVAGFLADAGFDTSARALEVYCMFSRLLKIDLDLQVPFEALLARQEKSGPLAGAFTGGAGKPRLACSWEEGTLLQAMLAYYEHSGGDRRALQAASRIVDWEDRMVSGKINVGSWGGNGRFGALEGLITYAWRTKDPKALRVARKIAELNRGGGGIRWMFRGEKAKDSVEHMHSCLTTVRGFPWLYAYTADRSYLDDAVAACDRVYEACTWANGCVSEWTSPEAEHTFATDECCCTADEIMLSLHLGDLSGEGRFFDRAEELYYNGLRFHQWFDGNFSGYDDPHIGVRGPHMWYCCTWWGAKALYETARHLYASSPGVVYINGFMPSRAELPIGKGTVAVATEARIPKSGDVRISVAPKRIDQFALKVRVPGWASLRGVEINGQTQEVRPDRGYVVLTRRWLVGDRVDVHFDLPLRVVLDNGQGPTPLAQGRVKLDGAPPAPARSVVIYRGPAILAQFRLQHGCELIWAYSGGDPHRFETVASVADEFTLGGRSFQSDGTPELVGVERVSSGVRLAWTWKTGPGGSWRIRRSACVKSGVPLEIEYAAEIVPPPGTSAEQIAEVIATGRFCGVRMPYRVSTPGTFFDKTGRQMPPRLVLDGAAAAAKDKQWLAAEEAELDDGGVRYCVRSDAQNLLAGGRKIDYRALYNATVKDLLGASVAVAVDSGYRAIYSRAVDENGRYLAKCRLTIVGRSQFE